MTRKIPISQKGSDKSVSIEQLMWKLCPAFLTFRTTRELALLKDIFGQDRGA
ncbi:MAG: hypothetical protein JRI86_05470 [Deltaproteobacteria bacterium]|nr:hypothetical protein [Deltaproteobacteria bacterium]